MHEVYLLLLANPFCSDDSFAYHLHQKLLSLAEFPHERIFFSYAIEIEPLLTVLLSKDPGTIAVIIIDTKVNKPNKGKFEFYNEIPEMTNSSHKAEWSIMSQFTKKNRVPRGVIVISVEDVSFTGSIEPLRDYLIPELEYLYDALVNFYLK